MTVHPNPRLGPVLESRVCYQTHYQVNREHGIRGRLHKEIVNIQFSVLDCCGHIIKFLFFLKKCLLTAFQDLWYAHLTLKQFREVVWMSVCRKSGKAVQRKPVYLGTYERLRARHCRFLVPLGRILLSLKLLPNK